MDTLHNWPITEPQTQLVMRRRLQSTPTDLPALPESYQLRRLASGETEQLSAVLAASFPEFGWTPERAAERLVNSPDVRAVYVAVCGGELVGTASVRYLEQLFPGAGIVHWVAVVPSHRGRQLGKHLTERVCDHIVADGYEEVFLETDDVRVAAIKTYLSLGFAPHMREPGHNQRWQAVYTNIDRAKEIEK